MNNDPSSSTPLLFFLKPCHFLNETLEPIFTAYQSLCVNWAQPKLKIFAISFYLNQSAPTDFTEPTAIS